ncbi:MAG: acyltransferase [Acidimicrobiales bacterium]|nr:acyltransferase [Acidimicrobiales bacterium]
MINENVISSEQLPKADLESSVPPTQKLDLSHKPGLDGIRGIMVIAVNYYHGGIAGSGGMYLGVEGFFVLSGYLITSLLLSDLITKKSVNFGKFWSRRARRLLPALLVLIAVFLLVNAFLGASDSHTTARGDALSALFYSANWYFIAIHTGYFGAHSAVSPLQHTWSLAIEEQFYLLWPLVISILWWIRRSLNLLLLFCASGIFASALLMASVYNNGLGIDHAYYGTDTRSQSLLFGCALAVILAKWPPSESRVAKRSIVPLVGVLAILFALLIASQASGPPGWIFKGGFTSFDFLVALIIAAIVVAPAGIISKCLSVLPLRLAGEISYGWYLWQFPVDQWLTSARVGVSGLPLFGVRILVGLTLAVISYRFIEQPIRRGVHFKNKSAFIFTPIAIISVSLGAILVGDIPVGGQTFFESPSASASMQANPLRILLEGDSIALSLGILPNGVALRLGDSLSDSGMFGCGVLNSGLINFQGHIQPQSGGGTSCSEWKTKYAQDVSLTKPDVSVLLVGRWEDLDRNFGTGWEHIGEKDFDARLVTALQTAISILHDGNIPVVLLTEPYLSESPQLNGSPWPYDSKTRINDFNTILKHVAAQSHGVATVIDLNRFVSPGGNFTQSMNGVQIRTSDGVHFTEQGSDMIVQWLFPKLNTIGMHHYLHHEIFSGTPSTVPPIKLSSS